MKIYNIPVFVPHKGCPHDCIFCNQKKIAGDINDVNEFDVKKITDEFLATIPKENSYIEIAFFGGSFTGLPIEEQNKLLSVAYEYKKPGLVNGIRLSTRPDYINDEILSNLKKYGVTTIELGVQSLDDNVLGLCERGYRPECVYKSSELIRKYGFNLGLQMMTGLPGDNDVKCIETAKKIISMSPDFVRIYPTLVVKNTKLERMYLDGEYIPQEIDEAVKLCKELYLMFVNNKIDVIRIALQTTEEIYPGSSVIAGPFHPAFGELVMGEIMYDKFMECVRENDVILVNPRDLSKAIGNKRRNLLRLRNMFGNGISIVADDSININEFKIIKNSKERNE